MNQTQRFESAKERYAALGVDAEAAMARVAKIPVSMHCWQGDDVRGFENPDGTLTGGIQATGNYPGRAGNIEELREDFTCAADLIPGKKKISLHAIYLDNQGQKVERDEIEPCHFASWADWAEEKGYGVDFNPTCFSHPYSADGFTVSHVDPAIRKFWVDHCKASRRVAEWFGRRLGQTCITNYWFPDGYKDIPADRVGPRRRMLESLDEIFSAPCDRSCNLDSVESKVFGIGAESYTVGSLEFCLGYAVSRGILYTMDTGHFHPTEVVSDKISSVMLYCKDAMLHVSRPVRWDSDHVVIFDDELRAIAQEIIRGGYDERVHIGLDFFDASINRIAAWVIGTRNMQKALLYAALEPSELLQRFEIDGNYTERLALLEELKTMPFSDIWDEYCDRAGVPVGSAWIGRVRDYENRVLSKR